MCVCGFGAVHVEVGKGEEGGGVMHFDDGRGEVGLVGVGCK